MVDMGGILQKDFFFVCDFMVFFGRLGSGTQNRPHRSMFRLNLYGLICVPLPNYLKKIWSLKKIKSSWVFPIRTNESQNQQLN